MDKPLPALPDQRKLAALTKQARAHLQLFVERGLEDGSCFSDENKAAWTDSILDALDELGASFARGNWLEGLRRASQTNRREIPRVPERKTPTYPPSESIPPDTTTTTAGAETPQGPVSFPMAEDDDESILDEIRSAISVPSSPDSMPKFKHLLLLASPWGSHVVPAEDSGFHLIPSTVGCLFTANLFPLSTLGLESIMYGLRGFPDAPKPVKLVGGTFTFKGVVNAAQHGVLCKTLRLAIYVHLSILVEQHFLSDSGISLQFPAPRLLSSPTSPALPASQELIKRARHHQSRSLLPSGILSIFSKRSSTATQGSMGSISTSRGSMDLDRSHRPSLTDDSRLRRFSFLTDATRPLLFSSPNPEPPELQPLFTATLEKVKASLPILSTSPDIIFPPCPLLVYLAEKEKKDAKRRMTGDEKAAMTSVLGWQGRVDDAGSSMTGITGFVRHQEISVLVSAHPIPSLESTSPPEEGWSGPCLKPTWQTLRYYAFYGESRDVSLGDTVIALATKAQEECEHPECKAKQWQHELRYIHNDNRLVITFDSSSPAEGKEDAEEHREANTAPVVFWQSCSICDAHTHRREITDGTCLLSFGKFLELLFYSPSLHTISPPICSHTSSSTRDSRYPIRRHFLYEDVTVNIELDPLSDVFELRVPRIQILRGSSDKTNMILRDRSNSDVGRYPGLEEQKTQLRKEILNWFHAVAQYLDKLEDTCTHGAEGLSSRKSLPRIPSEVEPDLSDDSDSESEHYTSNGSATPKAAVSGLPPPTPNQGPLSPSLPSSSSSDYFAQAKPSLARAYSDPDTIPTPKPSLFLQPTSAPSTPFPLAEVPPKSLPSKPLPPGPVSSDPVDSLRLLSNMRRTFQHTEQSLYAQLSQMSDPNSMNDIRRSFQASGQATRKRLSAWQKKHLSGRGAVDDSALREAEAQWWGRGYHAVPGGNVIVKEDDWGSIIAFTMGTSDYQRELSSLSLPAPRALSLVSPSLPSPSASSERSSFFGLPGSQRFKLGFGSTSPDPDQDDVEWHQPEGFSAVISRKTHPRDPSTLLSIRDVLRQKNVASEGSGGLAPRFAGLGLPGARSASGGGAGTPRSAWAKPAPVEVNTEAATGGVVTGLPDRGVSPSPSSTRLGTGGLFAAGESLAGKKLHELENASSSLLLGSDTASVAGSLGSVRAQARRRHASSIISVESDATIGKEDTNSVLEATEEKEEEQQKSGSLARPTTPPPAPPPKDPAARVSTPPSSHQSKQPGDAASQSSFASLTSSIANVMKMVLANDANARPTSPSPHHHGLLSSAEPPNTIDERPHIKYDWTIGKRLKFSCTVYYAKQFDSLRRRCGVDEVYLKSLCMSTNWAAEGGKSKSNFWKTADGRFIIKTLVNAWNVADLQVLLELAPSYFRYLDSTSGKPTVLAKLVGFYTIEIRNLETGAVQSKADLLVMENLFYEQDIVKTFDLKGIPGRKVKSGPDSSSTLFDGEWIEGQQKTLTLIRPHSKVVLQEAIKNDAEFLARSNIMDYSLLLGLDESKKEIACGLVDTIGSYTFAKTLEYKAKQGLKSGSGKETTVIPPAEYQERFVRALDGYFVACPDKWSKSLEGWDYCDVDSLPSVL